MLNHASNSNSNAVNTLCTRQVEPVKLEEEPRLDNNAASTTSFTQASLSRRLAARQFKYTIVPNNKLAIVTHMHGRKKVTFIWHFSPFKES